MWMCEGCEMLCPMSQVSCGGCGRPQSTDVADVTPHAMGALTADAEMFKLARPQKRKKR